MTTETVSGFTPVFDEIADKYGTVTALVFGVIWRHCEMDQKCCLASHQTLADIIGLSRPTIHKGIKTLIAAGLVIDHTPDRQHKPHRYTVAPGFVLQWKITAKARVPGTSPESSTDVPGGVNDVTSGVNDVTSGVNDVTSGVTTFTQRDSFKRLSKKQTKKERDTRTPPGGHRPSKKLKPAAVHAYREIVKRCPPEALWQMIDEAVGADPEALDYWREIVTAWIAVGWKDSNVAGMLERFKNQDMPATAKPEAGGQPAATVQQLIERNAPQHIVGEF